MKNFLVKVFFFLMPILIIAITMEVLLEKIPNDYSFKSNFLDKNSNNIEVLLLGSSHVFFGVNPDYLSQKSFNASIISQSLNYDYLVLEKYKNNWNNLKYIIIPIDYLSLYTSLETGIESWRVKNYTIYYGFNQSESYYDNFELFNGKLENNWRRVKNYFIKDRTDLSSNDLGWGTTYNSQNNQDLAITGKEAAIRHTVPIKNNSCYSQNINSIDSIIDFAKRKKIKIIFITCPAYHTYVENLNINQLNNTIQTITQIVKENPNTQYYNLLNDQSFVAKDFYDADHLNEIGAKKFTYKIDSIIKRE